MTDNTCNNIGFSFKAVVERASGRNAIVAEDLTLSYDQLWQIVDCYADCMRSNGIGRGSLVSVDTSDMIVSISSVFALSLLGAQFVPMTPELNEADVPKVTNFIKSSERTGLLGIDYIVLDESWSPKFRNQSANFPSHQGFTSNEDTCWILSSAGTTGRPKYSEVSQKTVYKRVRAIAEDYAENQTQLLLLFNCVTRPFIVRAVAALLSGATIVDTRNIEFASECGVNFICASVQQIFSYLDGRELSPRVPVLQASGAKLEVERAIALLRSFDRVEDVYGANETIKSHINVMTKGPDGLSVVGKLISGEIQIIDDDANLCAVGVSGKVRIRTEYMVHEYMADEAATAEHFQEGWFYPGDIGVWQPRNVLQILARDSDIINIGGDKYSLVDIEACLQKTENIDTVGCFENPVEGHDNLLACCVAVADMSSVSDAINNAWKSCAEKFGASKTPSIFLVVDKMPLTQDGVVQRKVCLRLFAQTIRLGDAPDLNERLFIFKAKLDG